MSTSTTIEIQGLSKHFGSVRAVNDLSFSVQPGKVTGFLGPNGAGKTTTLRMLLGLVKPSAGTATFGRTAYRELHHPLSTVGTALEPSSFHPGRTARAHLAVYATAAGIDKKRVDHVIEQVGLSHSLASATSWARRATCRAYRQPSCLRLSTARRRASATCSRSCSGLSRQHQSFVTRTVLAMALWAVIGVGVGTLLPHQVAAIVVVLAFTQFVEPVLRLVSTFAEWAAAVGKFLPDAASDAVVGSSVFTFLGSATGATESLDWWQGGLVLIALAGITAVAGFFTSWSRDVT